MTWTDTGFEAVAQLVGRRTGLVLASRRDSAELGIRRAMARAHAVDLDRYLERLQSEDAVLDDLVIELTVGETYFFREPAQFQFLRRQVLPALRPRADLGHTVRVWSAGCASGEEAYSLAILLEESGLGEGASRLLATDISRASLARARLALYGAWSLRGDSAAGALPYLGREDKLYRVSEGIRRRVNFAYLNLALDVYPSLTTGTWGMDIILCRNVLIYFDRDTIRRVAGRLFASLADGGWLLTASSDPPLSDFAPFEAVLAEEGVFYRKPGERAVTLPPLLEWDVDPVVPDTAGPALPDTPPVPDAEERPAQPDLSEERAPQPEQPDAEEAFAQGEYARVVELTRGRPEEAPACVLLVRALANLETAEAERACAAAAARHRLSTELHYLHAVLLLELGRDSAAVQAIRRVLYLDPSLAVAHFTLGSILRRTGDAVGARRAYRNARDLCAERPPDDALPLADGEPAGRLAEAASAELDLLDAEGRSP